MFTDHQANRSSDERAIPLRMRSDLVVQETLYQGEPSWIVKDPVAMKYFRLQKIENDAVAMLDGKTSYREIQRVLENKYPAHKIRIEDLHMLVNSLHKSGLMISGASGQTAPLIKRRNKELRQKAMGLASSIISLRFPGVDPDRFLSWLYPKVSWFFTKTCFVLCMLLCSAALILVLANLNEFYRRLPEFQQFFDVRNILFMGAILIVTKTIHELGHGLMCKHFGGECHEIGFMLLVLMPAMYCNTSDSWTLPNKWHRIAIGAAGMYLECVIAAVATFVWWYTHPGTIHYLALNIVFLCSISTILFNANPLLRYDGYYMLSDYLEIPNMSQKSKLAMLSKLRTVCLGMKPVPERMLPQRRQLAFAIYAVSAFLFKWVIMIVIFWFLAEVFEPYGLEVLGHLMIAVSLFGMLGISFYKLVKFFIYPGRFREVKKFRFLVSSAIAVLAIWAFCMVPVPHYVIAGFVVEPIDAQKVMVTQPGTLKNVAVRPGQQVEAGDHLGTLENVDLQMALMQLEGERNRLSADLIAFTLTQNEVMVSARQVGETQVKVNSLKRQIATRKEQLRDLTLVANRKGTVILPPNVMPNSGTWSGTPLDKENLGATLPIGTMFCMIGDPNSMKARLAIDQSDIEFVASDQEVTLMFDERAGERFSSTLQTVARDPMKTVPRELDQNTGGPLTTKLSPTGQLSTMFPTYEASVSLSHLEDANLMTGFRGKARIHVGSSSLGTRLLRYLKTVVNFR